MTDNRRAAPTPEATTGDKARYGECSGCHGARTAEDFARSLTHCVACMEAADAQHAASSAPPEATTTEPDDMASRFTPMDAAMHADLLARAEAVIRHSAELGVPLGGWSGITKWAVAVVTLEATYRATVAALTAERTRLQQQLHQQNQG